MNKLTITLITLFLGIQINIFAQNDNEISYQELRDIIGNATENTYLKDFKIDLETDDFDRFSVVLSKNTIYSLSLYQNEPNQFDLNLYSNKSEKAITPSSVTVKNKVTIIEYEIKETAVYHLFVKNIANKKQKTCVLLSFVDEFKPNESEELATQETKDKSITNDQENTSKDEVTEVFFVVEKMPKFKKDKANKIKDFNDYIEKELQYPQEALNEDIEGRVYIQFTIGKNGYVKDAKVARGVHPALDQEALRIVYGSPKWDPGTQRGIAVDVILTFPINFYIKNK